MSFDIIPDPKFKSDDSQHYRYTWVQNFAMPTPEDWGLAIATGIEPPQYITELWARFFKLDYVWRFGGRCVFMSNLLRKILRLHGYEAHTRQVILTWDHPDRPSWGCQIGSPQQILNGNELDVHQVCVVNGYILDWSVVPYTWNRCGVLSPLGFVGRASDANQVNYFDPLQDFGNYGQANWLPRRPKNDFVKHWRLEMQDELKETVKEYFKIYKMERHDAKRDFTD
jgi:hypothetical protein